MARKRLSRCAAAGFCCQPSGIAGVVSVVLVGAMVAFLLCSCAKSFQATAPIVAGFISRIMSATALRICARSRRLFAMR